MMDDLAWILNLPSVIPEWKNCVSRINKKHPMCFMPDVGGNGVDLKILENGQVDIEKLNYVKDSANFSAITSCVPFIIKNCCNKDICLNKVDTHSKKLQKFHELLMTNRCKIKKAVKRDYRKELLQVKDYLSRKDINVYTIKLPKMLSKFMKAMPDEVCYSMDHNFDFVRGCLSAQHIDSNLALLFHSSGSLMDKLQVTHLKQNSNESNFIWDPVDAIQRCDLPTQKGPIYQISTMRHGDNSTINCVVRQKYHLSYYSIGADEDSYTLDSSFVSNRQKSLLCVDINPYYPDEIVYTRKCGMLVLKDIKSDSSLYKKNLNSELFSYNWTVEYGSHPREIVCTSQKNIVYKDLRQKVDSAVIKSETCNSMLFSKRSPMNDMQHFFVTRDHVVLRDRRFHPVILQQWNHMLLSTPTMCDIVKIGDDSKYIMTVSTQRGQETCCIPLYKQNGCQPASSPLWHASKPSDLIDIIQHFGISESTDQQFLNKPLIGSCGVSGSDQLSLIHLSSGGDLFCQDFLPDFNSLDKTCVPSFGVEFDTFDIKRYPQVKQMEKTESKSGPSEDLWYTDDLNIFKQMISDENDEFDRGNLSQQITDFVEMKSSNQFEVQIPSQIDEVDIDSYNDQYSSKIAEILNF